MKNKSIKFLRLAIPIMGVLGLSLAAADSARAQSDEGACSNRTISGDYGYLSQGVLVGTPGLPDQAPFRSIGLAHFDGKGNMTWLEHTVINGVSQETDWTAASGSYTVNSNCTGTLIVNTPNSPVPLKLSLVAVKQGKEIRTVLQTSAIDTVFIRVD